MCDATRACTRGQRDCGRWWFECRSIFASLATRALWTRAPLQTRTFCSQAQCGTVPSSGVSRPSPHPWRMKRQRRKRKGNETTGANIRGSPFRKKIIPARWIPAWEFTPICNRLFDRFVIMFNSRRCWMQEYLSMQHLFLFPADFDTNSDNFFHWSCHTFEKRFQWNLVREVI